MVLVGYKGVDANPLVYGIIFGDTHPFIEPGGSHNFRQQGHREDAKFQNMWYI